MIRLLLLLFKGQYIIPLEDYKESRRIFNYLISDKILLCVTIGWLLNQFHVIQRILGRSLPNDINSYFSYLFIPGHPSRLFVYGVIFVSVGISILSFVYNSIILRSGLTFSLLWINHLSWGNGHQPATDIVFLLAHLLSLFLPRKIGEKADQSYFYYGIVLFHTGILFTYFLAGFWKLIGLIYKVIASPSAINWIHPDGALVNAIVSARSSDISLTVFEGFFQIPAIWQIGFIIAVIFQCFCIIAAFKEKFQIPLIIGVIIFHFINSFVFGTVFILQPLTIAVLFFPYYKLIAYSDKNFND